MILKRFSIPPSDAARCSPGDGSRIYRTHILRSFLRRMRKHPRVKLLDLGTVCGQNLEFLGRQGYKVYAEDLLANLRPRNSAQARPRMQRRKQGGIEMLAIHPFPHSEENFQGVLCWDVFDFLDRDEAIMLAREIFRVLVPGGLALTFFNSRKTESPEPLYRYRILSPDTMEYSCTGDKRLVRYAYQNRDIMQILGNFRVEAFYYLRNRMREVLAEKPRPKTEPEIKEVSG